MPSVLIQRFKDHSGHYCYAKWYHHIDIMYASENGLTIRHHDDILKEMK
jgi:hypothetical protein